MAAQGTLASLQFMFRFSPIVLVWAQDKMRADAGTHKVKMIQNQGPKANLHDFNRYVVWRIYHDYFRDIGNKFILKRPALRWWLPQAGGYFRSLGGPLYKALNARHL